QQSQRRACARNRPLAPGAGQELEPLRKEPAAFVLRSSKRRLDLGENAPVHGVETGRSLVDRDARRDARKRKHPPEASIARAVRADEAAHQLPTHRDRYEDFAWKPEPRARKSLRRDTDDRERPPVDGQHTADDVLAAEPASPERVAQHDDGRLAEPRFVLAADQPPERGAEPRHFEVAAGDERTGNTMRTFAEQDV